MPKLKPIPKSDLPQPKKGGRPDEYTPMLADLICAGLAAGRTLNSVLMPTNMPNRLTVFYWQNRIPGFAQRMKEAQAAGGDCMAEQMVDSADVKIDKDDVPAARLSFEKKKWFLSKRVSETYGDKQETKVDLTFGEGLEVMNRRNAAYDAQRATIDVRPSSPPLESPAKPLPAARTVKEF